MVKNNNKLFPEMSFVVFLGGVVLMGLEIMGGRLLAPFYGNSVYVWGSIISIFLISLSIGYYVGGYLADRYPSKKNISKLILLNFFIIIPIPFSYKFIIDSFKFLPFMFQPLASSFVLFLFPSIILGTISPYAIKLSTKDLNHVGRVSGSLYSIATIGSVIGTLVTTFIFTLFFPISTSIFILSVLVLIMFFHAIDKKPLIVICLIAIIILIIPSFINREESEQLNIKYNDTYYLSSVPYNNLDEPLKLDFNSPYGLITIEDKNSVRTIKQNGGPMGAVNINNPLEPVIGWKYITDIEIAFSYNDELKSALTIGLAGGTLQRNLLYKYDMEVDAVDINPKMIELSNKYFGIGNHISGLNTFIEDGRVFMNKKDKKYDLIVVDVAKYDGYYVVPFHFVTKEFFELIKDSLNEKGVFVKNVPLSEEDNFFLKSLIKTIKEVFVNVDVYEDSICCKIIVATCMEKDTNNFIKHEQAPNNKIKNLNLEEGIIFTDLYAPTFDFRNILIHD